MLHPEILNDWIKFQQFLLLQPPIEAENCASNSKNELGLTGDENFFEMIQIYRA